MAFLESFGSRLQEDMPFSCMDQESAMAEYTYWTELISGAGSLSHPSLNGSASPRLLWDLARFDTSVDCIMGLFHMLADGASEVPCFAICKLLMREYRITASMSALEQACDKVYYQLHGVLNSSPGRADFITFCGLWQRIMLAAVYSKAAQIGAFRPRAQNQVHVIRYGTGRYVDQLVTECQWTFGGYFAKAAFDANRQGVVWLRIDDALPSEVIRIGIKMYFHPLLIEDLLSTRTTCITQATCFSGHHCVSLELYYLCLEESEEDMSDSDSSCDSGGQGRFHGRGPLSTEGWDTVCSRIRRGVVTFVAPTARGANQHSVLTFIDGDEKSLGQSGSTRSQFLASQAGVKSYLNLVQQRICTNFQLREQPAGVLLYIVLNSADRQLRFVCDAYAERLSLLKCQTIGGAHTWRSRKASGLQELSSICLELKELLQWVDRLQEVADHLVEHQEAHDGGSRAGFSADCGQCIQQNQPTPMADWSLALMGNTRQAIRRSKASLLQQSEQAQELKDEFMQARQDLGDNALFIFSVIGSSYFPAQFLTGVFGMNFYNMPILHWQKGYFCFWVLSGSLVVAVPILIICGLQVSPDKRFLMSFSVALAAVLWLTTGLFSWKGDY